MPEVSLSGWNRFLQERPSAHLLQTGEWGELKSGFEWHVVRVVNRDSGAQILLRKLPFGFTIAYIPKLVISARSTSDQFWEEVDDVCRRNRAIFLKIEPDAWDSDPMIQYPFWTVSKQSIQPPRTIIVDIRGGEDEILARMKQKCRYNIHLAEKKGVTVRVWNDPDGFYRMIRITAGRDGFGVHSLEYYRRVYELFHPSGMCELLVAEFEAKPLAALMVFARGTRAWYFYGASSDQERNRMPTYLLQWEAMRWAKARGCQEYDLWGVPDEDESTLEAQFENRNDGLWGVYRFKRGFGGELRRAAQAVDKVYNARLYRFYLWRLAGHEAGS
ncbi:MAG TPA: peptidoglycan bridge formation glycyltransferase FemA/FemB family protein [Anaerolineales bacterium]|nr:peptidoglycan bridge formation glycyltransferase FemA/FemB family protein [Anaerolineales bacterium]